MALAAGGILALALFASAPAATAGTLAGSGGTFAGGAAEQATPENVYWVRRCWRVRTWWGGRWHWSTRCRSAWVGRRW
ncbi:hypothetical protein EZH22_22035 [Xanthobacter dioxanivorans]|uniref:Uncharacterized protein n=2 Tax=Xanthobacter dioxanivorans TaxID=2528964 RepID=A0A974PLB9_9HYPH|nr:hypothetical protein EZH22_22035 [Xanthobacter dioxanivorans]